MNTIRSIFKYWYVLLTHYCAVLFAGKVEHGKGLLLLRLDALGDFILWLDSAKEYRKIYPGRRITLLVNGEWFQLAKELPYWDDVRGVDVRKFRYQPLYRIGQLISLRRGGFDILIQPRFSRELLLEDSIALSSGAKERIGYEGDLSNIKSAHAKRSHRWYTKTIASKPAVVMELTRNAEFIRALGSSGFRSSVPRIDMHCPFPDDLSIQGDYYVVCPGAARGTAKGIKQWPLSGFAQIIRRVYEKTGWKAIICGDASQNHLGQELENSVSGLFINCIGKTSLKDFIAIISNANILVGNDSSCVHIAAAFDVPSVCVTGGGHFGRFVSYEAEHLRQGAVLPVVVYKAMDCFNCDWNCVFHVAPGSPFPCVADIDVEQVWGAIDGVIEGRK